MSEQMPEKARVAAGHVDWRNWVNERAMDSLDADMEGGDWLRKSEVMELAELLVRAEARLYTESQVRADLVPKVDVEAILAQCNDEGFDDICPLCDDGTEMTFRAIFLYDLRRILTQHLGGSHE